MSSLFTELIISDKENHMLQIIFCSSDKFGVRAKQLEHERPTHAVPVAERKKLTVSNKNEWIHSSGLRSLNFSFLSI